MPTKVRKIKENIQTLANRRSDLETELKTAVSELEKARKSVVFDNSPAKLLENNQLRINSLNETISAIDSEIKKLELELVTEGELEKYRAVIRTISELDRQAESLGKRYQRLWNEPESLSYKLFWEMILIEIEILSLKRQFHSQMLILFPTINSLLSRSLPELEDSVNDFFIELTKAGCRLRVLRSEIFSESRFPEDSLHNAFILPEHSLATWIRNSKRAVFENETAKARKKTAIQSGEKDYPVEIPREKFGEKILGLIPLGRFWK